GWPGTSSSWSRAIATRPSSSTSSAGRSPASRSSTPLSGSGCSTTSATPGTTSSSTSNEPAAMLPVKIKAAILVHQHEPLELAESESPECLRFGQVLVQVHYSGLCGSQLNEIDGTKGPDRFLPHLLGHEGCATVLETGDGVTAVKRGDKVVMHWRPGRGIQSE